MKNKILLVAISLFASVAVGAPCKNWVGIWDVTYDIAGPWTDRLIVQKVAGTNVTATDEFGNKVSAVCKAGVLLINDGDSDYVSTSWYLAPGFSRVISTYYNDFDLTQPWLLVDFQPATITKVSSRGASMTGEASGFSGKDELDNERHRRFRELHTPK